MLRAWPHLVFAIALSACSGAQEPERRPPNNGGGPKPSDRLTLAIIGTSDLHGHIAMLPWLGGHIANLVASGKVDSVLLLDGGDMFQGTLESNLNEGASVVAAYNHLGYAAVAVGNHEYDFGPAGERSVPTQPSDDPRGALKARSAGARFPFLAANLIDEGTQQPARWPNLQPSAVIEHAGLSIGIIGVSTMDTPRTTNARNFAGLRMAPVAETIAREAAALRKRGVDLVLVAAHAGGKCKSFDDPADVSVCEPEQEIFAAARELAPGTVDAIVAGHTHAGVAHQVNGVPIVQSFSKGIAFGRIDLVVEDGVVVDRKIHPPRFLCGERGEPPDLVKGEPCPASDYEGRPVAPDPALVTLVARYQEEAREARERTLGVTIDGVIKGVRREESPLGNLFADLMRAAWPAADVALTNGGGLRADLPAGELTYGDLYESMPFDNRFAVVNLTGGQLAHMIEKNLIASHGVFSISGIRVAARCQGEKLVVALTREKGGRKVKEAERLIVVTSDFLASGGDGTFGDLELPKGAVELHDDGPIIRDAIGEVLAKRGGNVRASDRRIYDKSAPRLVYPGSRPVRCAPR